MPRSCSKFEGRNSVEGELPSNRKFSVFDNQQECGFERRDVAPHELPNIGEVLDPPGDLGHRHRTSEPSKFAR